MNIIPEPTEQMIDPRELLQEAAALIAGKSPAEALALLAKTFPDNIVFSTSFGLEDQVISHLIFENDIPIKVFTLDTGRMFNETYSVWNKTLSRYEKPIETYFPQTAAVEQLVQQKGPLSFYESVDNRKECCFIRKVEPLNRALQGQKAWVTGIRAEQSNNRTGMSNLEWDEAHQLIKFHPIFDWTFDQVQDYIKAHNIPYNILHDRGFPSIGCSPCTRAVQIGEDFRAGRWWWEDTTKKECGLHAR